MGWLTGWSYRKAVPLSRASGAVTDYQILLLLGESSGATGEAVDCGAKCKTDFSDIRFTKADGTTLLKYWIEEITGTTPNQLAKVWIKFDSIGTGATTFYMYYGKADASAVSNGVDTFIVFDDFERGSNGDAVGGDWTVSGGSLLISTEQKFGGTRSLKVVGGTSVSYGYIPVTPSQNIAIMMRLYKENTAYLIPFALGNGTCRGVIVFTTGEDVQYYNGSYVNTGYVGNADLWQLLEIKNIDFTETSFDVYWNGNIAKIGTPMDISSSQTNQLRVYGDPNSSRDSWIDNVIVRNWRSVEPAWGAWGGEEEEAGGNFLVTM